MMVLEYGKLSTYTGNYTVFMEKRKKIGKLEFTNIRANKKEIERQEEIIDRLKISVDLREREVFPNQDLDRSS